ncbi:C40 family peptidase [soil metagenome]
MTSQLLFGEGVTVHGSERYFWRVSCDHDGHYGWIDHRQVAGLMGAEPSSWFVSGTVATARSPGATLTLVRGSLLPRFADGSFRLAGRIFELDGQARPVGADDPVDIALQYLGAPYLWGGRSPFGIDCSGLVQVAFGLAGIPLPRNSQEQARCGVPAGSSPDSVRRGDLVTCNAVTLGSHIGIALDATHILHASGQVRIDRLTEDGIVSADTGELTHHLGEIRRIRG